MHSRLKVLLLSTFSESELASCYRIRYRTAEILSQDPNIDVTIISPSTKSFSFSIHRPKKNLKVVQTLGIFPPQFRRGGFAFLDLLYKTYDIVKTGYNIIHVDTGHRPSEFLPAFIGKKINKSIIVNEWWEWFGKGGLSDFRDKGIQKYIGLYDNLLEMPLTKKYDGVIAITNSLKKRLRHADIYDNTIVLHGGAEISDLVSFDMKKSRSTLGLEQNSLIVGMINICEEDEEDNALFWKAFEKLTNEYDRLKLLVTGKRDYVCNKFMPSITFEDRIIYPGWVDREKYALYLSSCDFFVLPLRDNLRNAARWPNKISDYFAIQRPVLTNPVGDLKFLFDHYKLGLLCGTTVEDFYEQTKHFIESKKKIERYCSDQWEFAHNELNFDHRVDKIIEFYTSLLSRS